MNIINIGIKSQYDNANWTWPKKEKSSYEKGLAMNDENCKPKSLLLGLMSISIWCDQNLLSYSSFLPWPQTPVFKNPLNQTLEERVEKQVICRYLLGLLQVHPLWMACPAHVIFMMTGKWDTIISPHAKSLKPLSDFNSSSLPLQTLLRTL